ncbi:MULTISPECIES: antitoxin MazE-like protein [unclassified Polynucleobacter]|uniref:antitoxin MazE-like protein n=1 Tax=unclassified Polynucleobacter TaxID=2640945 RepID=UPI0025D52469|nr:MULTISPECIES: antitoxin MazE-like protein [unclassified Polynucleobacter]
MSLNSLHSITNYNATSTEMIEECRRQSALASSLDRADIDLMNFLDQILLEAE